MARIKSAEGGDGRWTLSFESSPEQFEVGRYILPAINPQWIVEIVEAKEGNVFVVDLFKGISDIPEDYIVEGITWDFLRKFPEEALVKYDFEFSDSDKEYLETNKERPYEEENS